MLRFIWCNFSLMVYFDKLYFKASTLASQSHAVSTWPPHTQDGTSSADRPHTISSAYEKGHQRPALTVYTFQNPETISENQKSPANISCRPPLPVVSIPVCIASGYDLLIYMRTKLASWAITFALLWKFIIHKLTMLSPSWRVCLKEKLYSLVWQFYSLMKFESYCAKE